MYVCILQTSFDSTVFILLLPFLFKLYYQNFFYILTTVKKKAPEGLENSSFTGWSSTGHIHLD